MVEPLSPERSDTYETANDLDHSQYTPLSNVSPEAETLLIEAKNKLRVKMTANCLPGKRRSKRASIIPDIRPRIQKAIENMRAENDTTFYEELANGAGKNADLPIPFPSQPFGITKREGSPAIESVVERISVTRKPLKTPTDYLPN